MNLVTPTFHARRCTRYRYRYSECARCNDACPHAAIRLSDEGATIDPATCQNCTLCVSSCRTGAWSSAAFKPIELLRAAIKQPAWQVACAPSGADADAVVPCLGAVDAVMLAYLAKRGMPVRLAGAWHCTDCAHGERGAAQLALNLDAVAVLREAAGEDWRMPACIAAPPDRKAPPTAFAAPRRQLFRRLFGRGVDEIAQAVTDPAETVKAPDQAIRAAIHAVPEQRELLQIVGERRDGAPMPVGVHDALPAMQLQLRTGCTLCEACFRACPTGALRIEENPARWSLTFKADRCVGCAVCLEVCQPRVLDVAAVFDARPEQPVHVLIGQHKQRCNRCDRHFASPSPASTCPVCCDDEDAFSAIFG